MLNEQEKGFIDYWEQNRLRKKRLLWQLAAGLPLGALLAGTIFLNYFSGWHKRAEMKLWANSSGSLVVIIALLLIIIFVVIFSSRHRWEMNEQRYKELVAKKDNP
jgi:protein-S-isoprenylcysteine O-methyltransferase Ste14